MDINISDLHEGSTVAFDELYAQYRPKLFHYIFQKTGSEYYSDEVVQVTFGKLWEKRTQIREDIPLSAQIFQIAKSSLIDILRKNELERLKIRSMKAGDTMPGYVLMNVDMLTPFVWRMAEQELPAMRGQVFLLRVKDQMSYEEISEKLNISVKTVARHINLAFQQMRPLLSKL